MTHGGRLPFETLTHAFVPDVPRAGEVTVAITQPRYPVAGSFPGFAYGWRGERVYVVFRTGVGEKRYGWHEAGQVRRTA